MVIDGWIFIFGSHKTHRWFTIGVMIAYAALLIAFSFLNLRVLSLKYAVWLHAFLH